MMNYDLVLASASPRRVELLKQINIIPAICAPQDIDETHIRGETPKHLVKRLAIEKAKSALISHKNKIIIAADTVVFARRKILGKPKSRAQAEEFLHILSGRRHTVIGGIAIVTPSGKILSRIIETSVKMKRLEDSEIKYYLDSNEWKGKAGGYGVQGSAAKYITQISGSYSNIVGLCLNSTYQILKGNGLL